MTRYAYDHGEDELLEREARREWDRRSKPVRLLVCWVAALAFVAFGLFAIWKQAMPELRPSDIPHEDAVKAILGEARGEGYEAMYAHACALRNRGTLQGVYGFTAKTEEISPVLYHIASKAWHKSEYGRDVTNGATHWLSDYDMRATDSWKSWLKDYEKTARVGTTTFYRRKRS